jgi:hypothetical protein
VGLAGIVEEQLVEVPPSGRTPGCRGSLPRWPGTGPSSAGGRRCRWSSRWLLCCRLASMTWLDVAAVSGKSLIGCGAMIGGRYLPRARSEQPRGDSRRHPPGHGPAGVQVTAREAGASGCAGWPQATDPCAHPPMNPARQGAAGRPQRPEALSCAGRRSGGFALEVPLRTVFDSNAGVGKDRAGTAAPAMPDARASHPVPGLRRSATSRTGSTAAAPPAG